MAAAGEVKITSEEIIELNNLSGTYGGYFDKRLLEYVFGRYGFSEVYESGVIRQLRVENVPVHLRSHLGLLDRGPISYSAISMAPEPLSVLHGILSAGKATKL